MNACDACLRRSALLGELAPWLERAVSDKRRLPALLELDDEQLLDGVCGVKRGAVDRELAGFSAAAARSHARAAGLSMICIHDDAYPPLLRDLQDRPHALYLLGSAVHLELLASERPVAVVGSRRGSPYGLEVARSLGRELAACAVPVVSGLALGVDSAAHEGALEAGGPTVAVMPGGADVAYPRTKARLHARIAREGLVVSELPPGAQPFRISFPARNRIMAGLAAMTVVVEGAINSGSLITAEFAQGVGREVGAVPGLVTAPMAAGALQLLVDGACLVRGAVDVLDAVYGPGERQPHAREPPPLKGNLRRIFEAVGAGHGSPGEVANGEVPIAEVLAALTELELLGLVRREASGRYLRCA